MNGLSNLQIYIYALIFCNHISSKYIFDLLYKRFSYGFGLKLQKHKKCILKNCNIFSDGNLFRHVSNNGFVFKQLTLSILTITHAKNSIQLLFSLSRPPTFINVSIKRTSNQKNTPYIYVSQCFMPFQ